VERGRLERAMDPLFTGCALLALLVLAALAYGVVRLF
jgi:hypothetical protein